MNEILPVQTGQQLNKSGRFYSPQLDGLRFCAAVIVFFHHAPALPYLGFVHSYGWVGVDLFLSISAYLITRLILIEHTRTGSFSLRSFYIRRALRIWPIYFGFASAMCALTVLAGAVPAREVLGWWVSHLTMTNNLATALYGYSPVMFSAHLWTISLEEQAYLVMPLLLMMYASRHPSLKAVVLFCLAALGALMLARLGFYLAETPHPFVWTLPFRADAFILGSLAAIAMDRRALSPSPLFLLLGGALLASVALFRPIGEASTYQVYGYLVVALGATAVVLGSQADVVARSFLAGRFFRYAGKISYGFYVYHFLGIAIATGVAGRAGLSVEMAVPIGLAVTFAMAAVSYRIFETPFLRLKKRFERIESRPI